MRCNDKVKIQESFLLDEVRCGFFVPSAIKQAWAAELEVLMEIDRVCKLHDIEYFADWGTLLGAVRHGGFIPWDDDLDIVMKREDYQKFMTVARFDMEEGFDVQTFRNQKDFWFFMGKVVGKNRFCFEKAHLRRFHNFPYIACVDIFVLDYVHKDPIKEEKRKKICKYILGIADGIVEGQFTEEEKKWHIGNLEEMTGKHFEQMDDPVEMGRYLYGEIEKYFAEVPAQEADYLVQMFPWGLKDCAGYYPKEYYQKAVRVPFESMTIPVSPMYDKMLRMRYGDYWRSSKNAGGHNYPFFEGQKENLQKVLDFDLPAFRFKEKMLERSAEERGAAQYSYKAMAKECIDELARIREELVAAIKALLIQAESDEQCMQREDGRSRMFDLLGGSQQLAVDLGTLLEQIKGEGCTCVGMLEKYCETLYRIYEQLQGEVTADVSVLVEELKQTAGLLETELEGKVLKRKAILFLPVMTKDWESLHSLRQAAAEDENNDIYVVPLPYYYKDYDGSAKKLCYEGEEFPEEINVLDYRILTREYLELLHPEVIIIQNPYDAWHPATSVPEIFYAENIRQYTDELIYVPPFAVNEFTKDNAREYANMQYYVTMPGVVYADGVIVQSANMKQMYVEKLTEFAGEDTRGHWQEIILPLELPIIDEKQNGFVCEGESGKKADSTTCGVKMRKKLLYGIGSSFLQEKPEKAQRKIESNLKLFDVYKNEIEVTVVHFPEDDIGFVSEYDAYYGDPMPVMMEFVQAGKPVMIQSVDI